MPLPILDADAWTRPAPPASTRAYDDARAILDDVRARGDAAIADHSERLDGVAPARVELRPFDAYGLDAATADAVRLAHDRVRAFAELQRAALSDRQMEDATGTYGQRVVPVASVGAYVPGGRHPLVSTALMTLVPARVAGVPVRVAVSPSRDPAILAACSLAGATAFVHVGGAQAVAALAFGSGWHPAVDLVVGPGNAWVTAAKALVQGTVGIDTLAGPSEVLLVAGPGARADWLAWDLLAQAEHDPLAVSVLASWSRETLAAVAAELDALPEASGLADRMQLVHAESAEAAVAFANRMGAEHLHVHDEALAPDAFTNYGSLFLGPHSAVALGDYVSGPNHTLPTGGYARVTGGLSVGTFLRVLTWQRVTPAGVAALGPAAVRLARAEGLTGHARSVDVRLAAGAAGE